MPDTPLGSAATIEVSHDDLDAVVNLVERLSVSRKGSEARWHAMPENEREAFDRIRRLTDGVG